MKMKKDIICAIAGMAAAAGVKLFGGWTPTLSAEMSVRLGLVHATAVYPVFRNASHVEL